ncbi:MAG: hypothetical protein NW226_13090 [Microscillaceae bacterium]|nr:hypothetical protein [Microscillaceae bacterium]
MNEGHKKTLLTEKFLTIKAGLQAYRLNDFIKMAESKKGAGKILPFVRGLRFSALLIYAIRDFLVGSDLTANWGHIIDEDGEYCSRECDIIIHNKKGQTSRWNGNGGQDHIMDFRFIEQSEAKVVISCKSFIKVESKIEVDYCNEMRNYVNQIWLFAECCPPKKSPALKTKAKQIGYDNFWHLYTLDQKTGEAKDALDEWLNFVEKVKSLM